MLYKTVYLPNRLLPALQARGLGNGENVVARDLERYYALLERAKARVVKLLSEAEISLLQDVLNGVDLGAELVPHVVSVLIDAVGDARADGLDEKWGVDAERLAEKIASLTPIEAVALVDAIEQFWESQRD